MNQEKIGKFIAECRKEKGLTQMQLAEQLGVTNRAVSKWETAKSMPDVSVMLPLCEILGVSVNELLCGEKMSMQDFKENSEKSILQIMSEIQKKIKEITEMGFNEAQAKEALEKNDQDVEKAINFLVGG